MRTPGCVAENVPFSVGVRQMKPIIPCAAVLLAALVAAPASAGVFKCTRPDGKVAFQDTPCAANETSKTIATPSFQSGARESADPLMAAAITLGLAASIDQVRDWCATVDTTSVGPIAQAQADWRSRHAVLLDRTQSILRSRLSGDERSKIDARIRLEGVSIVSRLSSADRASQLAWCRNAPAGIDSPQMDLNTRPTLVKAIMSVR